jgi:hypothetical protein
MALFALTNVFAHFGPYDFTGDSNKAELQVDVEALDATVFAGSGWRSMVGGLKSSAFDMAGFWQSAVSQAVDPEAFALLGAADKVLTFGPSQVEGDPAFMMFALESSYKIGGEAGALMPFELGAVGEDGTGTVRGRLTKARGNVSATGAIGTGQNLGAVSATQGVYCTIHVFSPGTTITLQLQSDDNAGFTTPTTIATIGPITAAGGTWVTKVPGPLTDSFFRLNVSAITGTFNMAAAIGVQ